MTVKHGLVLSGGGARGDVEAGAQAAIIAAYKRTSAPVVSLSGTSVGALNAAGCAAKDHWFPLELWKGLASNDVYRGNKLGLLWRIWRDSAIYDTTPLWDLITSNITTEALAVSPYALYIHVTLLGTKQPIVFLKDDPDILTGIYASAAVPGAFPPVSWNGHWAIDGGTVDNSPIRSLISDGCEKITVIILDDELPAERVFARAIEPGPGKARPKIAEIISPALEAMMDAHLRRDLKNVELVNRLVAAGVGDEHHRKIDLRVWAPRKDLGGGALDFDLATDGLRAATAYHSALEWAMQDAHRFPS
ncbi:MAG: patatin-like phospholipase family protein [Acidobacteriota bacterium]